MKKNNFNLRTLNNLLNNMNAHIVKLEDTIIEDNLTPNYVEEYIYYEYFHFCLPEKNNLSEEFSLNKTLEDALNYGKVTNLEDALKKINSLFKDPKDYDFKLYPIYFNRKSINGKIFEYVCLLHRIAKINPTKIIILPDDDISSGLGIEFRYNVKVDKEIQEIKIGLYTDNNNEQYSCPNICNNEYLDDLRDINLLRSMIIKVFYNMALIQSISFDKIRSFNFHYCIEDNYSDIEDNYPINKKLQEKMFKLLTSKKGFK